MIGEQGRYVGIDLDKRSWEAAVITQRGKCRRTEQRDLEPEERTAGTGAESASSADYLRGGQENGLGRQPEAGAFGGGPNG
jgi:predicted NBD/HSP70 family sugar kinase